MVKRFKQFYNALTAKFNFADVLYVRARLNDSEAQLFFQMGIAEQVHAVNTAKAVEKLLEKAVKSVDRKILLKAALLHDVGKIKGSMKLWHKSACVLFDEFCPCKAQRLASFEQPKGSLAYALYVYYHHPRIGARKLEKISGGYRLCALVRFHHEKKSPEEIATELYYLKTADGMC